MWNTKITRLKFYPFNEHVSIQYTYCINNGQGYSQNFIFSLWIILFSFTWRGMWENWIYYINGCSDLQENINIFKLSVLIETPLNNIFVFCHHFLDIQYLLLIFQVNSLLLWSSRLFSYRSTKNRYLLFYFLIHLPTHTPFFMTIISSLLPYKSITIA